MFTSATTLLALAGGISAELLWDGRLNDYDSSAFLDDWSWSNQDGPYQYYIHGSGSAGDYVNLGNDYKNPADGGSDKGIQISIDSTSQWNGGGMLRTELIPSTDAAINKGKVFYHFSMQHTGTNPPSATAEHQVCFFESHFTEMKYGLISGESGTSDNKLQWYANSESQWDVTFEAGVWHNIAYAIDFDAGTVAFYHSTGGDDLELVVDAVSVSADSNGQDWHLGVLQLGSESEGEDWNFSGVYIESGELTTSVSGPGGASNSGSSGSAAAPVASSSSPAAPSSSSAAAATSAVVSSAPVSGAASSTASAQSTTVQPTSTAAASTTRAQTTMQTKVRSSSEAAPAAASGTSVPAIYSSSSAPASSSVSTIPSVSSAIASATSSAAAVSSAPATSVSSMAGPSSAPAPAYSPAEQTTKSAPVPPMATGNAGDEQCEINYVYVDA